MIHLEKLTTEDRNTNSMVLDAMPLKEQLLMMNAEDQKVALAIRQVLPEIELVIGKVIESFKMGGRLFYLGAGTSGRLGVLDAAECVPTFGVSPSMVVGLIAGGESAMRVAVEGAEDSLTLGASDLQKHQLTEKDTVVGLAASGRTPYVIGALDYARGIGARTVAFSCNENTEISQHAELKIEVDCGPEFLTGSTRLKAGTAQKLILNMISTLSMVGIGKVYKNLMVDLKPTNEKLIERSKRIIMQATDCDYDGASTVFEEAGQQVKTAIIMILTNSEKDEANKKLEESKGFVKEATKQKL